MNFLTRYRTLIFRIISFCTILPIIFLTPAVVLSPLCYVVIFTIGILFILTGILGRVFASIYMGNNRNFIFISNGTYSVCRNPLYFFTFLALIGISLTFGSIIVFVISMAIFLIYYRTVILTEEKFLTPKFGESYKTYLKTVPRFFPNFGLWRSPNEVTVNYKSVLKTIFDTSLFLIIALLIILINYLKLYDIIPIFMIIY